MTRTAMIMAAGLGTRMRPLTDTRPKPLLTVAGKTLIDYSIEKLHGAGVRKIIVNVHYLPDMVEAHLAKLDNDMEVIISDERSQLMETGGGLVKALPFISDDPFFCVNSDNILAETGENSLTRLTRYWDDGKMDALLLVAPVERTHHHKGAGDFFLNDGRLERRGARENAPYIYTGTQLISHHMLQNPPPGPFSTNILWNRAAAQGRLFGMVHQGDLFDIGSPDAIAPTEAWLLKNA